MNLKQNIFSIPILQVDCNFWESKKQKLLSNFTNFSFRDKHYTDYYNEEHKIICVDDIFKEEINIFKNEFQINKVKVDSYWFEKSKKYNYHEVHKHQFVGYSAVCYVEYDENEHEPLIFVSPFDNFVTGSQMACKPQNVKEGTIIFFPSRLQHYVNPNMSDKERLVFSFNLTFF
jgi:hypothetical protein